MVLATLSTLTPSRKDIHSFPEITRYSQLITNTSYMVYLRQILSLAGAVGAVTALTLAIPTARTEQPSISENLSFPAQAPAAISEAQSPPYRIEFDRIDTDRSLDLVDGGSGRKTLRYLWPTGSPAEVLRDFSIAEHNWLPGHRGVDLKIDTGGSVFAPADGMVIYAGRINDRSVVSIEHPDGIRTTYEPVLPLVTAGQRVKQDQIIATVEPGHCPEHTCLHWGAKRALNRYLNPLHLLEGAIILLE